MDLNILDIDSHTLRELEIILDNKSTRDSFLKAVPPDYFDYVAIQQMDNGSYRYTMTTARWLLFKLGRKGTRVSDMISWLEKQDIQKALVLLKKEVPLQIIEQPPAFVRIKKGSRLVLRCKASSYPPAEYQWFKEDKELPLQEDSELSIHPINEENVGIYICLVSKLNLETRDYSYIYSSPVEVIVEDSFENQPSVNSCLSLKSDVTQTSTTEIIASNSSQFLEQIMPRTYNIPTTIRIVKHPFVNGKIPQGMSVCLYCKAKSKISVKYQWFKNGRPLNGATSDKLDLNDLQPDGKTGDMKWEYFCEVTNEYDRVISNTAIIELEKADTTTPYFASEKYAFMIANEKYEHLEELKKPAYDVADLAKSLESMKFKVFSYINLTFVEMKNAFRRFCAELKPNSYLLFYFAGHGFEQYGQMYLQPVDSSEDYRTQECICTEDILERMQRSNPAMNILLIDACRKLPPQFGKELNALTRPGEVFEGKMKNNTVYGYSTPFLYSSHESNFERNSFFVKYLKKYICHNKSIQDILFQVQRDFEGDPHIKGVQFPVIKTSLSACRKLCDEIDSLIDDNIICLEDIKGDFLPKQFEVPRINSSITIEVCPYMDVFINGVEIVISLDISEKSMLVILKDLEVNLTFNMEEIQVVPLAGIHLKNLDLKVGSNNLSFKNKILTKQILGLQKVKVQKLIGKLCLKFSQLRMLIEREILINIEKISNMNLSVAYPDSQTIEDAEIVSCENNVSFNLSQN